MTRIAVKQVACPSCGNEFKVLYFASINPLMDPGGYPNEMNQLLMKMMADDSDARESRYKASGERVTECPACGKAFEF